jgi:hypothetical protein
MKSKFIQNGPYYTKINFKNKYVKIYIIINIGEDQTNYQIKMEDIGSWV